MPMYEELFSLRSEQGPGINNSHHLTTSRVLGYPKCHQTTLGSKGCHRLEWGGVWFHRHLKPS